MTDGQKTCPVCRQPVMQQISRCSRCGHRFQETTPAATVSDAPQNQEVIRTRRLEIVNDADQVQAVFGSKPDGTVGMVMRDSEGRQRLEMGVDADQNVWLAFKDHEAVLRAYLILDCEGNVVLSLDDAQGQPRANLSLTAAGPMLCLQDAGARPRVVVTIAADGNPQMSLLDPDGVPLDEAAVQGRGAGSGAGAGSGPGFRPGEAGQPEQSARSGLLGLRFLRQN